MLIDCDSDDLAQLTAEQDDDDDLTEDIPVNEPNPNDCDHTPTCKTAERWIQVHCYDCGERLARPVHDHCYE